jgi:predicted enzyme related to lactoylglutathione lyase
MTKGATTIIYPTQDLARAKALFTQWLGVEPFVDEPYYVGYRVAGQDIGLDPNGHAKGMTGPVAYWDVEDVKAAVDGLVAAGAEVLQDTQDVGGGKLIAMLKVTDGHVVGLAQQPA